MEDKLPPPPIEIKLNLKTTSPENGMLALLYIIPKTEYWDFKMYSAMAIHAMFQTNFTYTYEAFEEENRYIVRMTIETPAYIYTAPLREWEAR